MKLKIENMVYRQYKSLAYAYALHIIEQKLEGWHENWSAVQKQAFCDYHQCMCSSTFNQNSRALLYYCPRCECVIDHVRFVPNYLRILREEGK